MTGDDGCMIYSDIPDSGFALVVFATAGSLCFVQF
jgi:hypothetical protein